MFSFLSLLLLSQGSSATGRRAASLAPNVLENLTGLFLFRFGWTSEARPLGECRVDEDSTPLEAHIQAKSRHDGRIHVPEPPGRIERLLERLIDDLKVGGRVEPPRDRHVVIHLDRVFLSQTQTEPFPEKREEIVAQVQPRPSDPEAIVWTSGDDALAADSHVVRVLDRVRYAVRDAEPEEDADAPRDRK